MGASWPGTNNEECISRRTLKRLCNQHAASWHRITGKCIACIYMRFHKIEQLLWVQTWLNYNTYIKQQNMLRKQEYYLHHSVVTIIVSPQIYWVGYLAIRNESMSWLKLWHTDQLRTANVPSYTNLSSSATVRIIKVLIYVISDPSLDWGFTPFLPTHKHNIRQSVYF